MRPSTFVSSLGLWLSCTTGALAAPLADIEAELDKRHAMHPVHISDEVFNKIQRYANFTSASLQLRGNCPYPPFGSVLANYINIDSTDTQASLFRDDANKEFILSMPGTSSETDQKIDSMFHLTPYVTPGLSAEDCEKCQTHTGFLKAWNSLADEAARVLHNHLQVHPNYKITITGHSLGAALASLATSSLKGMGFPVENTYTFGEPRVGNQEYADHIDKISGAMAHHTNPGSYHRVTHADDVVPQEPKTYRGYRHSRTEYWEYDAADTETSHKIVRCWGQEPAHCNNAHVASSQKTYSRLGTVHQYYGGVVMGNPSSCGM